MMKNLRLGTCSSLRYYEAEPSTLLGYDRMISAELAAPRHDRAIRTSQASFPAGRAGLRSRTPPRGRTRLRSLARTAARARLDARQLGRDEAAAVQADGGFGRPRPSAHSGTRRPRCVVPPRRGAGPARAGRRGPRQLRQGDRPRRRLPSRMAGPRDGAHAAAPLRGSADRPRPAGRATPRERRDLAAARRDAAEARPPRRGAALLRQGALA